MKRKIILVTISLILCLGLFSCSEISDEEDASAKEVAITDCIKSMTVDAVEKKVIYWTVKFNKKFNKETFDGLDFFDVIKKCLNNKKSKRKNVTDYSVFAYDSNGTLRFSWGRPDKSYDPIHEWDADGNPLEPEYSLTKEMYNELLETTGK